MCKHSKVGGNGNKHEPHSVSNLNGSERSGRGPRCRSHISHIPSLDISITGERRILTRSVSTLFTKLKNNRRKIMFKHIKPGIRSSSRLNKSKDRLLITRASRQAADLCNGLDLGFDRNPSEKLLFMLSLGLSPNLKSVMSIQSPAVVLAGLPVFSSRVTRPKFKPVRKAASIQSSKENIEIENVRVTRRMAAVSLKSDRKLRSSQEVNKMENMKLNQFNSAGRNTNTKGKGRLTQLSENVATRIRAQVSRVRKGLREQRKRHIPTLFFVKKLANRSHSKNDIICIDLTGNDCDSGVTPFAEFKKLSKYGMFIHPIC